MKKDTVLKQGNKPFGLSYDEWWDNVWKNASLKQKIQYKYWDYSDIIRITFLVAIGRCPHEASMGAVGAKWHHCLQCHKKILNEDWKFEKKYLKAIAGRAISKKEHKA